MSCLQMDKFAEPLQEPELAQSNLDLASWIIQDDDAQLGFCQGAKEMHSSNLGELGHASPPFITSTDVSDFSIHDFDLYQPLSLDDCFLEDVKSLEHSHVASNDILAIAAQDLGFADTSSHPNSIDDSQLQPSTSSAASSPHSSIHEEQNVNLFEHVVEDQSNHFNRLVAEQYAVPHNQVVKEQHVAPSNQVVGEQHVAPFNQVVEEQHIARFNHVEEQRSDSINETIEEQPAPVEPLLLWNGNIPAFVAPTESVRSVPAQQIISVPIRDAVVQRPMTTPVFKTIPFTQLQPKVEPKSAQVMVVKSVPSNVLQKSREPQKIVINLIRVSANQKKPVVAPTTSQHVMSCPPSARTLKDVMSSQDADDQLADLLHLPSPQPSRPSIQLEDSFDDAMDVVELGDEPHEYEEISIVSPDEESFTSDMTYEELTSSDYKLMLSPTESCYHEMISSPSSEKSSSSPARSYKSPKSSSRKGRASSYTPLEKKLRKKEQNKRAALRYRQKKKGEEDSISTVLQREEERQKKLQERYSGLLLEMKLMKKLMKEVLAKRKSAQS